ncbi:hypothetical protein [Rhodoferax sp.]|uniref:hypothetical protein n=1 Tax=Rhodoferax sp. TaxID=50421 RepID=UPI00276387B5|nr:hypothetical protein [Rhodoferax sp.]
MYKLTKTPSVIHRIADGASIPADPENRDYVDYLAWVAAGNAPELAMPLAEQRADAVKKIDAETDALIGAVIGNRASEYERAEAQAIAYAAAGYTGPVPSSVQSWADAKVAQGWTTQMAADDILATANAWRPAQEAIRAQRLLRKEQARAAADPAAVAGVLAQWAGFLAAIRGQLGV